MIATAIYITFTLIAAFSIGALAVGRAPNGDTGGFWAAVLDRIAVWLGLPALVLCALQPLEYAHRAAIVDKSAAWFLVAGAGFAIVLLMSLSAAAQPEEGRWIAGSLEFSPVRHWLLWLILPLLPALFRMAGRWTGDQAVFALAWAVAINFAVALIGAALSASPAKLWAGFGGRNTQPPQAQLSPWPDEMQSRGVTLHPVTDWEPAPAPEPITGGAADWQRRLATAGSPAVSGVLCQAVSRLAASAPIDNNRVAIVLGPDSCGQEEAVALAATELSRRFGEATLVITSSPKPALARRLDAWLNRLGGESPARLLDLSSDNTTADAADLILVDAETLSDAVLDRLQVGGQEFSAAAGHLLARIGMVVWWDAQEFSGVLAAHVWAVSRRLERLLRFRRGLPPRALIFARRPRGREAPFLAFLEHLLPYPWRKESEFQIEAGFARKTFLYRLEAASTSALDRATQASLLTDWPTFPPNDSLSGTGPNKPAESPAAAGARVLEMRPPDLLSLREMICQGGRATAPGLPHHVAIAATDNPYIDYLLSQYAQDQDLGASLHLLSAEGHPELVRRHLLLALREAPDTMTGLRSGFRWEEDMLRGALEQLSADSRLSRVPVRFLDADGRLQRDSLYTSQSASQGSVRSFRIMGGDPVELRDPNVRDGLLLEIDPERLPIDAYPFRVFESRGRRYRVKEWPSARPKRIACTPEQSDIRTWRYLTNRISAIKRNSDPIATRGLQRYGAAVQYHEDVTDVLERDAQGAYREIGIVPVRTKFATQALIMELTDLTDWPEIVSAAALLRHVLPVNTALEDDLLEVVPFMTEGRQGIALVDLYPGSIGLASAIQKAVWLVPMLFDRTARWISYCQKNTAAEQALQRSPLVRTMGLSRVDLKGALRILAAAGL